MVGGCFFILVLGVSAFWEADIRWLHFVQAWMYIATIILSLRANKWGYFIGISAAGLWDYANIFATTFFFNGMQQLSQWIHTGHLERPDLLICRTRLVFQSVCRRRLLMGVFAITGKISG